MTLNTTSASTMLDRVIDTAADNLRIAKVLVQLGFDPNNITLSGVLDRRLEIFLAHLNAASMCALAGVATTQS
jgi:hypothetical protein